MTRLVWLVLNGGRSVVAGCGNATRDTLAAMLREPQKTLTLTSDGSVEQIPGAYVRDFVVFDAKSGIPPAASIYRLV